MFWDLIIQLITRPKPSKQIVDSFVLPFFILIKAREDWHILANKYKQYFLGNYKAKLSNFVYKPNSTLCVCVSRSVMSDSLRSHGLQPTKLLCPWDFPGNNTGVDCLHSLQRRRNCLQFLSRETTQPRDQTLVFCITGRFSTVWTTGESFFTLLLSVLLSKKFENIIKKGIYK